MRIRTVKNQNAYLARLKRSSEVLLKASSNIHKYGIHNAYRMRIKYLYLHKKWKEFYEGFWNKQG